LHKGAGERCRHQFSGGCRVHGKPLDFPLACHLWACHWLTHESTGKLQRPDRSHYVIDPMPDEVTVRDEHTGKMVTGHALQVWVDPHYPDAWKDPALLAYVTELNMPMLVRHNSYDGVLVMPDGNRIVERKMDAMVDKDGWNTVTNRAGPTRTVDGPARTGSKAPGEHGRAGRTAEQAAIQAQAHEADD